MTITVGEPVRAPDGNSLDWRVDGVENGIRTTIRYGLLRWDDIVRARFPRSNLVRLIAIPALWWRLWRSGYLRAFRQEAWQFFSVILTVHLIYAGLVGASLALANALVAGSPFGDGPAALRVIGVALAAYPLLGLLTRLTKGRPLFVTHLVDDTAFTHAHAAGRDGDMRLRLEAWAHRIRAAEPESCELVVVGHSSSSFLAVEALALVLASDPGFGRRGTPVVLVTLGGVIPWIALDPRAEAMREALRRVGEADAIPWLDLRAPWDWLSIHRRSPLALLDPDSQPADRPLIRGVGIEDLIEPALVARGRWNFFRMHFQLLMSSRDPRAFDYIALVTGAEPVHRAILLVPDSSAAPPSAGPVP